MTTLPPDSGRVDAPDGLKVFYRCARAPQERARLVICHGLGEHSGRYANVIAPLLSRGISVWAPDLRGHGQSEGPRGHVAAFDRYLDDLAVVVHIARREAPPEMACFLLGHSLGGLVALRLAQRSPDLVDGLVLSSPSLGLTVHVPALKSLLGKALSLLWPSFSMANELDPTRLSHDPAVVQAYIDDPLVHNRVSARWFTEFLAAMQAANREAFRLSLPCLLQLAGDDHLTSVTAAEAFFQGLGAADRTLRRYDGLYHEIYNAPDEERAPVLADLTGWIEARLTRPGDDT